VGLVVAVPEQQLQQPHAQPALPELLEQAGRAARVRVGDDLKARCVSTKLNQTTLH
jgi:hypothetical protein